MFKAPFSFDGRIRRIEYFLSGIVGGIVTWIAMLLGVGTFIFGASSGSAGGSVFGLLIGLAALVASVWFSLAQGVKRLHDLNKSGWLILLMFIPIVNAIFGLYMLFADGTVGPNQYGADPKNRNEESAGKIKSRRITHGNKYIRKTMIECAWGASKTQNCFFSKFSYTQTVIRKKNAMKVKVAIARKMLIAIWHVLSDSKPYIDYKKPDTTGNS